MANQNHWCFAWLVPDPHPLPGQTRAALLKAAQWTTPGEIIKVSFLDGDPAIQDKVKQAAQAWTAPLMANLTLQFIKQKTKGDIRISFKYEGSWSVIGTTCRHVTPKSRPTMNFGWLDQNSTDEEIRSVVLHEFGHALGLIHEHQNPGGKINWNRDQIIKELSGPPNYWSLEVIEANMFEPYGKLETNFTELDPASIMMYPIPARWTTDGFSTGLNTDLSPMDRQFIREQYP
jgi:serralysin